MPTQLYIDFQDMPELIVTVLIEKGVPDEGLPERDSLRESVDFLEEVMNNVPEFTREEGIEYLAECLTVDLGEQESIAPFAQKVASEVLFRSIVVA